MWLRKEIDKICVKEFGLRHQLDIIQDNAYLSFNLRQLISLNILPGAYTEGGWQQISSKSNSYWCNIVEFLKRFTELYEILDQKKFLVFKPLLLKRDNFQIITCDRIQSCKNLIEIGRSIAYRSFLRDSIARTSDNRDLFQTFLSRSSISDPPGIKSLALNNRITFIRNWFEKLIATKQSNYPVTLWKPIPLLPIELKPSKPKVNSVGFRTPSSKRAPVPTVSETKPVFHFVRFQEGEGKPSRLSDLLQSQDSTSISSSESIWQSPFKRPRLE